jgi:hypothetical protein
MNTQPEDNTKPEALRLVEWLETSPNTRDKKAAAELRRLHEVNQELVNAVLDLLMDTPPCDCEKTDMRCPVQNARAVLEKSRGNT